MKYGLNFSHSMINVFDIGLGSQRLGSFGAEDRGVQRIYAMRGHCDHSFGVTAPQTIVLFLEAESVEQIDGGVVVAGRLHHHSLVQLEHRQTADQVGQEHPRDVLVVGVQGSDHPHPLQVGFDAAVAHNGVAQQRHSRPTLGLSDRQTDDLRPVVRVKASVVRYQLRD